MAWSGFFPVVQSDTLNVDDIMEIRTAINERCAVLSISQITTSVGGDSFAVRQFVLECQSKLDSLIPQFWDSSRGQFYTRPILFADLGIGDSGFWDGPSQFSFATKKHINDLYLTVNALTKLVFGHTEMYRHIRAYGPDPYAEYDNENADKYPDDRSAFLGDFVSGVLTNNIDSSVSSFLLKTEEACVYHRHIPNFGNSLFNSIDDSQTTMQMSSSIDTWPGSGMIRCDDELISYGSKDNTTRVLSGCTRGASGSTASSHSSGAGCFITGSEYFHQETRITRECDRGTLKFGTSALTVDLNVTLSGGIGSGDTIINVNTTIGLPDSGYIKIESEVIHYTGKTDTSFTGVTRGENGTTPASHSSGTVVKISFQAAAGSLVFGNQKPSGPNYSDRSGRICSAIDHRFEMSAAVAVFIVSGSDTSLHDQNLTISGGVNIEGDSYLGIKFNNDNTGSYIALAENEDAGLSFHGVEFSVNGTFDDSYIDLTTEIKANSYFASLSGGNPYKNKVCLILDVQFSKRS